MRIRKPACCCGISIHTHTSLVHGRRNTRRTPVEYICPFKSGTPTGSKLREGPRHFAKWCTQPGGTVPQLRLQRAFGRHVAATNGPPPDRSCLRSTTASFVSYPTTSALNDGRWPSLRLGTLRGPPFRTAWPRARSRRHTNGTEWHHSQCEKNQFLYSNTNQKEDSKIEKLKGNTIVKHISEKSTEGGRMKLVVSVTITENIHGGH